MRLVAWVPVTRGASHRGKKEFGISERILVPTGRNRYFILEPGFRLVFESKNEKLVITVLNETKEVNGILTRVVEEREWKNGKLIEVSRNFFAICDRTKDVFYFGEKVDMYKGGKVDNHKGAWLVRQERCKSRPDDAWQTESRHEVQSGDSSWCGNGPSRDNQS